jgi:hypothetical protein
MPCSKCKSGSKRTFKSEMTIAFREVENVNRAPLYLSQDISVCMDCGHIELALPAEKLAQLKKEALRPDSRRRSVGEGSGDS